MKQKIREIIYKYATSIVDEEKCIEELNSLFPAWREQLEPITNSEQQIVCVFADGDIITTRVGNLPEWIEHKNGNIPYWMPADEFLKTIFNN